MDRAERLKPKGYNKKAWLACFAEATADHEWALKAVKDAAWINNASESSLVFLGECLSQPDYVRAKSIYDYLYMRASGQTFLGALDESAREKWEKISGKRILAKHTWKYDHTKHITSARYVNKQWVDFKGELIAPISVLRGC